VEKFRSIIKKELLYYLLTLIFLAVLMHIDLISDPFSRLDAMNEKGNYFHPFLYSSIIYGLFLFIRKALDFILGFFKDKND